MVAATSADRNSHLIQAPYESTQSQSSTYVSPKKANRRGSIDTCYKSCLRAPQV